MRKIEQEMLRAIAKRRNWKKSNTRVNIVNKWAEVFLFGNKIAQINLDSGEIYANHCGWPTRTTLSRFRALGIRVRQENKRWLVDRQDNPKNNCWEGYNVGHYNGTFHHTIMFDSSGRFMGIADFPVTLTDEQIREKARMESIEKMKNNVNALIKRLTRQNERNKTWWSNPHFF